MTGERGREKAAPCVRVWSCTDDKRFSNLCTSLDQEEALLSDCERAAACNDVQSAAAIDDDIDSVKATPELQKEASGKKPTDGKNIYDKVRLV